MPEVEFRAFVDACYAKVFFHTLKQVRNDQDAADITQNTFLKAFLNHNSVRKQQSFEPWLFAICNNEIKQFYRSRAKDGSNIEPDLIPAQSQPQDAAVNTALHTAIDALPDAQRQVVLLKYFAGYTMQELVLALDVRITTVKSRLYEARRALKHMLDTQAGVAMPSLQKERRHMLMSMLELCNVGAKTIPLFSLHAQKQLLECAKENSKFGEAVLAELANIPTGQEFLSVSNGKLSYDELVRILSWCDEPTLYRIAGRDYMTWRHAKGNALVSDVAALHKTGGYVDSIEFFLYVPSISDTKKWYKKYLNWESGDDSEDELAGHAIIHPYSFESAREMYKTFKGFHLRRLQPGTDTTIKNCVCSVMVSGLEALRETILTNGCTQVEDISLTGWGTRSFRLTDLNGFVLEFCEWVE